MHFPNTMKTDSAECSQAYMYNTSPQWALFCPPSSCGLYQSFSALPALKMLVLYKYAETPALPSMGMCVQCTRHHYYMLASVPTPLSSESLAG